MVPSISTVTVGVELISNFFKNFSSDAKWRALPESVSKYLKHPALYVHKIVVLSCMICTFVTIIAAPVSCWRVRWIWEIHPFPEWHCLATTRTERGWPRVVLSSVGIYDSVSVNRLRDDFDDGQLDSIAPARSNPTACRRCWNQLEVCKSCTTNSQEAVVKRMQNCGKAADSGWIGGNTSKPTTLVDKINTFPLYCHSSWPFGVDCLGNNDRYF